MAERPSMCLLYTTWPAAAPAREAAAALLEEGLIACANILSGSTSIYRWQGEVKEEGEIVALFKTAADRAERARDRLVALHPYEEPCVIALGVETGASAPGFLDWVEAETRRGA
ncbi:divalent-cation tolerance protein CutA [Marinicauda algicola]|uniref:Divalent-cation tolerance protein CutA n=1 Tax=Marinicauda algicola TaxID=2029849 RepID=A0A4S2GX46_9PROT|nr:divalent-cation tolerance protein CutA [Marinicauda algicola]TGY87603.1 divalent-cation tolerance protein CutA [Marinicauda algicola]